MIETERLILREFEAGDARFALELLNEPAFLQFIGDRGVRALEDAARWIESGPRTNYVQLGFGHYVVVLKETETAIGMCGLRVRDGLADPDLGYALLQQYWSCGYAGEAARAVIEFSRTHLRLPRLLAICSPDNGPSVALLERLGFTFQRTLRLPNENHDVRLYALELDVGHGDDIRGRGLQSELGARPITG